MTKSFKASQVHPGSWWLLGLSFALMSSACENPVTLILLIAAIIAVIIGAREKAPWSQSLRVYLLLSAAVVIIRVLFRIIFTYGTPTSDVIFELPRFELNFGPLGAISLLGPLSKATLLAAVTDGLRMAAIIMAIGMSNSLANPKRLLKSTPGALYEIATSLTIAINLAPQLIISARRVAKARRLRGRSKGIRNLNSLLIPTLEDTLEQSLALAASMDARGFGRQGMLSNAQIGLARFTSFIAVATLSIASYLILTTANIALVALLLVTTVASTFITIKITGRRNLRTRFAAEPWRLQDFVIISGSITLATLALLGWLK